MINSSTNNELQSGIKAIPVRVRLLQITVNELQISISASNIDASDYTAI